MNFASAYSRENKDRSEPRDKRGQCDLSGVRLQTIAKHPKNCRRIRISEWQASFWSLR
jgi:hypothetical protein